ncbi:MAG TPA: HAD family hydrolase [Actinomycetes bacterium]|jgi:phosphoglycolate phosphatase-like HAD superfamily hydrolase|nr:HAD family hydrolase [Actinomycetes bacterium]
MAIVRRDSGRSSPADRSDRLPHLVWDWNGTLFDDVAVVVTATSESFEAAGLPPVTLADYHLHYTRPIPDFYQRVLGRSMSEAEWRALDDGFHRAYRRLLDAGEIDLVPGSRALLEQWMAAGGTQSLLSMWHHDELMVQVDRLGIERLFIRIDGLRGPSGGRKAAHLRAHLAAVGVAAGDAVVIGDSLDDAHAATAVGARAVLYAGGFHGPRSLAGAGVPVVGSLDVAVAVAVARG